MKSADQMFKEAYEKMVASDNEGLVYTSFEDLRTEAPYHTTIELMKSYAAQLIEQDREDTVEAVMEAIHGEGIYGFRSEIKESIVDRPLPEML